MNENVDFLQLFQPNKSIDRFLKKKKLKINKIKNILLSSSLSTKTLKKLLISLKQISLNAMACLKPQWCLVINCNLKRKPICW